MLRAKSMQSRVLYDGGVCTRGIFKIQLKGFLQVSQGFLFGFAKARNVYIKTLGNVIFAFLVYD